MHDLSGFAQQYQRGLLEDVLPFWLEHALDHEYGGYCTALARDGQRLDTDKSIWHHGRFAWLLGKLHRVVDGNDAWLEAARLGISFLDAHGFDASDGRMWFHVARDGTPLRKRRYAFSEAFAALAYGELAHALASESYRQRALDCFERFRHHTIAPKFTTARPTRGLGHPMITLGVAQELRESLEWEEADAIVTAAIEDLRRYHLCHEHQCVLETAGPEGELIDHIDGRTLNPGHAIEAAWFVLREAHARRSRELCELGTTMLDWTWKRGWDGDFGGLLYFVDALGEPVQEYWHDMKFWWPHNEAIIATLYAYLLTGDEKYREWHRLVHDWSYAHFPDSEYGEWYGYLHRDGTVSQTAKGNLWKGPFHLPRMQLVCWKLLEALPVPQPLSSAS